MPSAKNTAIELIQSLPEECTFEDIQYHLYVREKIARGDRELEAGETFTQEEVEAQVREWGKSLGPSQR